MSDREWFELVQKDPKKAVIVAAQGIAWDIPYFGTYRLKQAVEALEKYTHDHDEPLFV